MKTVAIVGAGAAGLCVCRHFSRCNNFKVTVFEKADYIGGTWFYDGRLERRTYEHLTDTKCKPGEQLCSSSIYRNLRTNLPKEVMAFPDFPFASSNLKSFITHTEVQDYLETYCKHFDMKRYISFGTEVINIEPSRENPEPGFIQWLVKVKDLKANEEKTGVFDFVFICNGHFTIPRLPSIENLSYYKGFTMHSRYYKNPEPFAGKVVAVLGAKSSGQDIALDVSTFAKKVYICHRGARLLSKLPDNIEQQMGIVSASQENGDLLLSDGSNITADAIIFCTGYHYEIPFLSNRCKIDLKYDASVVAPLYKHVLHQIYPSLAFIGLPVLVAPFPIFDSQVQYTLAVYSGNLKLPSREVMKNEVQEEMEEKVRSGLRPDQLHQFSSRQWAYHDNLAKEAGFEFPAYMKKMYEFVWQRRRMDLTLFKEDSFSVTEDKKDFIVREE